MDERQSRLWNAACGGTGQGKVIASYILGMYNGYDFHVDLTDLRILDFDLKKALLEEIAIDSLNQKEIHRRWGLSEDAIGKMRGIYGIRSPFDSPEKKDTNSRKTDRNNDYGRD